MRYIKRSISLILITAMLFTTALADISSYTNNNENTNHYSDGIFTAQSTGSGLFAIALYKNNELVRIKLQNEAENLDLYSLSTVVDTNEADFIKLFRFDNSGKPLCISKKLLPKAEAETRIYLNEDFSDNTAYNFSGDYLRLEGGRLSVTGNGNESGPRAGNFRVYNSDRLLLVEADFYLDTDDKARLFTNYYLDFPRDFICAKSGGIYAGDNKTLLYAAENIDYTNKINVALKLDLAAFTYDAYVNRVKINPSPLSLEGIADPDNRYNLSFYIPHVRSSRSEIWVDNVRAYSGHEFLDIGNKKANVHRLDYSAEVQNTTCYERPAAETIAKHVLENDRPRLMINKAKLEEIKNSDDALLTTWRTKVLEEAYNTLSKAVYNYHINADGSIAYLRDAAKRVMALGLAYMINGGDNYAQRAYDEAEAILVFEPDWGSIKGLDTGEIALILSIIYDWMYSGLSHSQRATLEATVMENSIYPLYKTFHGTNVGITTDINSWWNIDNNWNAVCYSGVFAASVAFMEKDSFTCATTAEAALRGIEYLMPRFAPAGAWAEGPAYWEYTMEHLTVMLSTLKANCNSFYGIEKSVGFDNTGLYSLSTEGKAGVVNFGDTGGDRINAPSMLYWSGVFNNSEYTSAAIYMKNKFGFEPNAFDLIYYSPSMYSDKPYEPRDAYYYEGTEMVSLASGTADTDSYIAISGGKGHSTSHDHLDSGAVIVDMKGERVLWDIGAEHYMASGYFDTNRHLYFRTRPEAHNTFIINPMDVTDGDKAYFGQSPDAVSEIDKAALDLKGKRASMDLSAAYARDAESAVRTISLDGDKVIIEDNITLKENGSEIFWNWYLKKDATNAVNISIDKANKSATLTRNLQSFVFKFDTSADIDIYTQAADYYVDVDPKLDNKRQSNDDYVRLVVKMAPAQGAVSLKTVIE